MAKKGNGNEMAFTIETIRKVTDEPAITHCSSMVETASGDLVCVWYECPYETSSETVIKIARKPNGSESWGTAQVLFNFHGMPVGNPVLWMMDDSEIHIVFSVLLSESWTASMLFYASSRDDARTWSAPTLFLPKVGFMAKTRPVTTDRGQILFPVYHEGDFCPYVMIIDDLSRPLASRLIAETMARGKAIQPTLIRLASSTYAMLSRTNQGRIWKSISYNDGLSWSICVPTRLPNPNSALDLGRLKSGEIILAYNPSASDRHRLTIALSKDNMQTWVAMQDIVQGDGEYAYPCLLVDKADNIHVSFTENRYIIQHAIFDREWVTRGHLSVPFATE